MLPRTPGFLYCATAFISSAMLLVLEIVAGRILAPYVGVSLYTWTSIIGVVLAGLSVGNWLGGSIADKGGGHRVTGLFLVAGSGASFAILPLLVLTAGRIQNLELDLLSASFIYVSILFFVPAVLLGVITPLVTILYLRIDHRTGAIVGRMHALAALGSIAGTFCTGFVLIQWMGTRNIVVMVGIILLVLAIPFLWLGKRREATTLISLLGLSLIGAAAYFSNGLESPCTVESNYYCLRVVDETDISRKIDARTLVLDHMVHSTNVLNNPAELRTPYIRAMDELIQAHFPDPGKIDHFFAGGGAYTHPRSIAYRYPEARITVSEIDPAVTALAERLLFLDPSGMTIHHDDTRNVISRLGDARFDVMITDVFHDIGIPYHLTTLEFAESIASKLSATGLYMLNVIDVFPSNRLIQSMVYTLKKVFPHVYVWIENPPKEETRLTFVLSVSHVPQATEIILTEGPPENTWYEIGEFIEQQIERNGATLLSDDYAPVERLLNRLLTSEAGS